MFFSRVTSFSCFSLIGNRNRLFIIIRTISLLFEDSSLFIIVIKSLLLESPSLIGSLIEKVVPIPGVLRTLISPFNKSTNFFVILSPKPAPGE